MRSQNTIGSSLRNTYVRLRRQQKPGYNIHPKFRYVWPRLADQIRQKGADPVLFVEVQFSRADAAPFPNMLLSERAWDNYDEYLSNRTTALYMADRLAWELREFSARTKLVGSAVKALQDANLNITPLLRYTLAEMLNHSEIADTWKDSAAAFAQKYVLYRDAVAAWKETSTCRQGMNF